MPISLPRFGVNAALRCGAIATAVMVVALPSALALADDVLEGSPVVRRNSLYRADRQEIGVVLGLSLGDSYKRNLLPGARYDLHLTDWISVGADLMVGIPLETAASKEITVKVTKQNDTFVMETSRIALIAGGHVVVAPISGKLMLLDSLPVHYDLHVNLGVGVASTPGISANGSPPQSFGVSPWVGGGGRLFVSRVLAFTADVNNFFIKRTLSVNRDSQAPGAAFTDQLIFSVGASFFVPPTLKRAE